MYVWCLHLKAWALCSCILSVWVFPDHNEMADKSSSHCLKGPWCNKAPSGYLKRLKREVTFIFCMIIWMMNRDYWVFLLLTRVLNLWWQSDAHWLLLLQCLREVTQQFICTGASSLRSGWDVYIVQAFKFCTLVSLIFNIDFMTSSRLVACTYIYIMCWRLNCWCSCYMT